MQYLDFGLGLGECMPLSLERDRPSSVPHQDHGPGFFKGNLLVSIPQGDVGAAEGSCVPVQVSELKQGFYHEGT